LCRRELAPERLRLDVVRADALAVDLDDRNQLAVTGLERRIVVDRNAVELEPELPRERDELLLRPLAKVAPVRFEQDNPRATDTSLA
jgi:hypothetical protein